MKLNAKIALILVSTSLLLLAVLAFGLERVVMVRFETLERRQLALNHERLIQALDSEFQELDRLTTDWAVWDDAYRYMQGKKPDYRLATISAATFDNLGVDSVLLFDAAGRLHSDFSYDRDNDRLGQQPAPLIASLSEGLASRSTTAISRGFLEYQGRMHQVAVSPILTSAGEGPRQGWLVMLRGLNQDFIDSLAERTQLNLQFYPLSAPEAGEPLKRLVDEELWVDDRDPERVAAYSKLFDLQSQPILLMRVEMPRAIVAQGRESARYFLGFILLATLVLGVIIFSAIRVTVLRRLEIIGLAMARIGAGEAEPARLPAVGSDEIGTLAAAVNHMLDGLDQAYADQRQAAERQREQNALLVKLATHDALVQGNHTEMRKLFNEALPRGAHAQRWAFWLRRKDGSLSLQDSHSWDASQAMPPPDWLAAQLDALLQGHESSNDQQPALNLSADEHTFGPRALLLVPVIGIDWSGLFVVERYGTGPGWPLDEENFLVSAGLLIEQFVSVRFQQERERELRQRAERDALTGLANRAMFEHGLAKAIAAHAQHGGGLAVLFLDLDRFKPVNDEYGHAVGDWLLQQVALRIREQVRAQDLVARLGGDEFTVVLDGEGAPEAAPKIGLKLVEALRQPFAYGEVLIRIGCSVGIACYPQHGADHKSLINAADLAMYAAKQAGRNTCRIYTPLVESAAHPDGV